MHAVESDGIARAWRCLVYLGGMARVRAVTRTLVTLCAGSVVLLLVLRANRPSVDVTPFAGLVVASLVFSLGVRLHAVRLVSFARGAWALAPMVGPARRMPPVVDVYETHDDVVVLDRDGTVILLGVDRLGGRDPSRTRQVLVDTLPRLEGANAR
jgi:hypothetical protein